MSAFVMLASFPAFFWEGELSIGGWLGYDGGETDLLSLGFLVFFLLFLSRLFLSTGICDMDKEVAILAERRD